MNKPTLNSSKKSSTIEVKATTTAAVKPVMAKTLADLDDIDIPSSEELENAAVAAASHQQQQQVVMAKSSPKRIGTSKLADLDDFDDDDDEMPVSNRPVAHVVATGGRKAQQSQSQPQPQQQQVFKSNITAPTNVIVISYSKN